MADNSEKKFKTWRGEDEIVFGKFFGEQEEEGAEEFIGEVAKLMKPGEKERLFIDGSEAGKSSAGARKAYVKFAKSVTAGKIAIFGVSTLLKVIATFIIRASGTGNVRFFTDKEEALKWLKEE
jgi:hypothetical protein